MSFEDPVDSGKAGRARMKVIAAQNETEVRELVETLVSDLGRTPTGADMVLAEVVASALVRSRRKRERGQDDRLERQQVVTLLHNFPSLRGAEQRAENVG